MCKEGTLDIRRKWTFLKTRNRIKEAIRHFFLTRDYTEVETPYLVSTPGEEVHLNPFCTTLEERGEQKGKRFLHTSPEFAMKRIVAAIQAPIFQFARVWRNEEDSPLHRPEFTMLEWYCPAMSLEGLISQTQALVKYVMPPSIQRNGYHIDFQESFERLTVQQAFEKYAHVDILQSTGDVDKLSSASGYSKRQYETWEDLFFRIFLDKIEPHLGQKRPTFLTHWPIEMAALAKRDPHNEKQALRFELYIGGVELTNGFEELTDPHEQKKRFVEDRHTRSKLYPERPQWPIDEDFLAALEDLPPCCGNALGFDRLVMLHTGAHDIKDVQWITAG